MTGSECWLSSAAIPAPPAYGHESLLRIQADVMDVRAFTFCILKNFRILCGKMWKWNFSNRYLTSAHTSDKVVLLLVVQWELVKEVYFVLENEFCVVPRAADTQCGVNNTPVTSPDRWNY